MDKQGHKTSKESLQVHHREGSTLRVEVVDIVVRQGAVGAEAHIHPQVAEVPDPEEVAEDN